MKHLGIEIEFTGITRDVVAEALGNLFNTTPIEVDSKTVDNPYKRYRIKDKNGNYWRIMRDRSVKSQQLVDGVLTDIVDENMDYKCELVSPILNSKTIGTLFTVINVIKALGGVVNDTCGIHIHIDALPVDDMVNLFKRFVVEQSKIFDTFNSTEYRRKKYCKPYNKAFYEMPEVLKSEEDFTLWLWKNYRDHEDDDKEVKDSRSLRYYGLNFYSLYTHHTIEYRLFNATLDTVEIANMIKWVLNFTYPLDCDEMKNEVELLLLKEIV